tara:strand:- start:73 stop:609 length:537 start_codon:yes stop_codon:yes gene_type:complete
MIPIKVTKIAYHAESRSYAITLKEITGNKKIPLIVGSYEAQSIALAIESVDTPRPLTHDLICNIISGVDGDLKNARIYDIKEGVFFAQLDIHSKIFGKKIIDSRPSDAIAVALRMKKPILVSKKVFDEAGFIENDNNINAKKTDLSIDELNEKLKTAIDKENYEIAAKLRDKISELKS